MKILPPDTPADLFPVPYEDRRPWHALPLNKPQVASFKEAGLATMLDVDRYIIRGGLLTDLKGVGKVSAEKILETYIAIQETRI